MYPIKPLQDLMREQFPEQLWLVDRLIAASSITMMSGAPASYKTYTALTMALAVASGKPFLNEFETNPGSVLLVDEENGERLLQQMLSQLHADIDLPIHFYSYQGFVLNDENVEHILWQCQNKDIKMLIIDSYVRVRTGDENSPGDTAEMFKQLKRFSANDIAVLVLHHNRKPSANNFGGYGNEMRGSSDILAAPDGHIALVRSGNNLTFYQTKQRYAREIDPFEVAVSGDDENIAFEYIGKVQKEDKEAKVKETTIKILSEHPGLMQKDLLEQLRLAGIKTNEHSLRIYLSRWVTEMELNESPGRGKSKNYSVWEAKINV